MKKLGILLMVLGLSVLLIACNREKPGPTDGGIYITYPTVPETTAPETTVPETTVPETTAQVTEPEKSDLEIFLEKAAGIWIYDETITPGYSDSQACFAVLTIRKDALYDGYYPGEIGVPGVYEDCDQVDDKTFLVYLFYKKGDYGGSAVTKDYRELVTFVITGKGKMKVKFDDGVYYTLISGGSSYESANKIALGKLPKPTEPTVPETTVPETTVPETTVPETTAPTTPPSTAPAYPTLITWEEFMAMTGDEQWAYYKTFPSMEVYKEWYDNAKREWEKKQPK